MSDIELGISQWSLHRGFLGDSRNDYTRYLMELHSEPTKVLRGPMTPESLVDLARSMDVTWIDPVNVSFFGRAEDRRWLSAWREYAESNGVAFNCLMLDELGDLGASAADERRDAIRRHQRWIDAGAVLGCRLVRVNAHGDGNYLAQLRQNAESLDILAEYADERGMRLVVENHGHPSNTGAWLAMLVEMVGPDAVGVYLDFDNFFMGGWGLEPERRYDRHQGMLDLAPYAIGASAKSYDFDADGNETTVDFHDCIDVLRQHSFRGVISAEFEGHRISEVEGARSTLDLLRRVIAATETSA